METGPSLEPRPQGLGNLEKKKKCQNQNCKIRRTKLKPHPKNYKFLKKIKTELLY